MCLHPYVCSPLVVTHIAMAILEIVRMCMWVYPFTHLFCHRHVWGSWKLIPFSKALPGGRSARDWIFEMTHPLCLFLSVFIGWIALCSCKFKKKKKGGCGVAKDISPSCSLPVSGTMHQLHPTLPAVCHFGSQGRDRCCWIFQPPACDFLESPPRGRQQCPDLLSNRVQGWVPTLRVSC